MLDVVTAQLPNGERCQFAVHSSGDSHVSPTIAATRRWEPFATNVLWSLLGPGDGVLDVGANIGWYSVVLGHAIGHAGWVHSFEPDPTNAALLEHNAALAGFGNITVHRSALSDREGTMRLALSDRNLGDHRLSLHDSKGRADDHSVGETRSTDRHNVSVPVQTMDSFATQHKLDLGRLRVIKVDTQGAEAMIFRGATQTFGSLDRRTALLIEFAPNLLRSHGPKEVDEFIERIFQLGRRVYTLRRASMVPTDAARLRRLATKLAPYGDEWAVDLLVCPDVMADRLRLLKFRPPRPLRWV